MEIADAGMTNLTGMFPSVLIGLAICLYIGVTCWHAVLSHREYRTLLSTCRHVQKWGIAWFPDRYYKEYRVPKGFADILVTDQLLVVVPRLKRLYSFYTLARSPAADMYEFSLDGLRCAPSDRPGWVDIAVGDSEFTLKVSEPKALLQQLQRHEMSAELAVSSRISENRC